MSDELMTIRQMCDAFGVTPRTLRFYESKELLFPIREGSRRLFTKSDRGRLKLILRGKRFGFSLEEIRELLELYNVGDQQLTQYTRAYEVGLKHYDQLKQQRDELDTALGELEQQLKWGEQMIASMKASEAKAANS